MEEPDFDKIFKEYLNDKYAPKEDSFWSPEFGKYHASSMGKCLRQTYYKHIYGPKKDLSSYPNFELGNTIERIAEHVLSEFYGWDYVKNSFRIHIDNKDFDIVGQTDILLFGENLELKTMFEIKSTKNIIYNQDNPNDMHVMQVHPYMKALNLDSCYVLYIQKTDMTTVGHEVEFDDFIYNKGVENISILHKAIENESPPPPKPFKNVECSWCNYKPICPGGQE